MTANGHVIPNTPIAVDCWRVTATKQARLFFLSHAHADHTVGLTSTWQDVIYTSPETAKIIIHKLRIKAELIKILEIGETHHIPLEPTKQEYVSVTLLDANHCPGAVMFLFEGYFGSILYTGDFRYNPTMLQNIQNTCTNGVDELYLDNTYCNPKFAFEIREKAAMNILNIITVHFQEYDIFIGMRYIGKEQILLDIAKYFSTRIFVDEERYELYVKILGLPNVFTTDYASTRIRVIKFEEITTAKVAYWNRARHTVAILPTCLYNTKNNHFKEEANIYVVPYSDHSSFAELEKFVKDIQPKKIHPIVRNGDVSVRIFDHLLSKEPLKEIQIPKVVDNFMFGGKIEERLNILLPTGYRAFNNCKVKGVVFESPEKSQDSSQEVITSTCETADVNLTEELKTLGLTDELNRYDNTEINSTEPNFELAEKMNVYSVRLTQGLDFDNGEDDINSTFIINVTSLSPDQFNDMVPLESPLPQILAVATDEEMESEKGQETEQIADREIIVKETPKKYLVSEKRKCDNELVSNEIKKLRTGTLFSDSSDAESDNPIRNLLKELESPIILERGICLSYEPPVKDCSEFTSVDKLPERGEFRVKEIVELKVRDNMLPKKVVDYANVDVNDEDEFMFGKKEYEALKLALFRSMKQSFVPKEDCLENLKTIDEERDEMLAERKRKIDELEKEGKYSEALDLKILLDWQNE